MLSAMLDREDLPGERATAEAHLAECALCRQWWAAAAAVTRLARTAPPTTTPPVPDRVLDAAPGPGRRRLATALRTMLGGLGAVQLGLGLLQLTGFGRSTFLHDGHAVAV